MAAPIWELWLGHEFVAYDHVSVAKLERAMQAGEAQTSLVLAGRRYQVEWTRTNDGWDIVQRSDAHPERLRAVRRIEPSPQPPAEKGKDKDLWTELTADELRAAVALHYDEERWDEGLTPDEIALPWRHLPSQLGCRGVFSAC